MAFDAPWGLSLKLMTLFTSIILLGVPAIGLINNPGNDSYWLMAVVAFPIAIWIGGAIYLIRGYELSGNKLLVQRLLWKTEVELDHLQSAEVDPEAMSRSIRTFGNGGLFSFSGRFRNKKLGPYRAFVNDPKLAVVLKFSDKTIVVTPDNPGKFAEQIQSA